MRELRGFGVRINLLSLPWCAFGESSLGLYHLAVIFLYLRDFLFCAFILGVQLRFQSCYSFRALRCHIPPQLHFSCDFHIIRNRFHYVFYFVRFHIVLRSLSFFLSFPFFLCLAVYIVTAAELAYVENLSPNMTLCGTLRVDL